MYFKSNIHRLLLSDNYNCSAVSVSQPTAPAEHERHPIIFWAFVRFNPLLQDFHKVNNILLDDHTGSVILYVTIYVFLVPV